jgi:hypothetical protein
MTGSGTPRNAQSREGTWNSFNELYIGFIWSKENHDWKSYTKCIHSYSGAHYCPF